MKFSRRFLTRGFLLSYCSAVLVCAQPTRPHASPARDLPTKDPLDAKLPPPSTELKLLAQFDLNGDQRLDRSERQAARTYLAQHPEPLPAPNPGHAEAEEPSALEPARPGEKLTPAQVTSFADRPLYDPATVRTFFLEFDDADWEAELTDFARTDVQVPARLTVDGRSYADIGVHFQPVPAGASLPPGYQRSLSLALDFAHGDQRLGGEHLLKLEDARTDPTLTRSLLYRQVAREYLAVPRANFVRLVINGEIWGIYVSTQPLDDAFVQENFGSTAGARWLALGRGNLAYLGDDPAPYRERYRLLSPEDPAAWKRLIQLCRTLDQTSLGEIEMALKPQLDVDRTLRFLALETALMNQEGYTGAGRGYGLYLDPAGRFHFVPLATEASFRLLPAREFVNEPVGGGRDRRPEKNGGDPKRPAEILVPTTTPNGTPRDFPRENATDLAMMLSYSFVNKVDRNDDLKLSRDEWLDFSKAWFRVIDEDLAGEITRDQFTVSVRNLVSPPSMRNPKAKQTFAGEDAASAIARDLWNAMSHQREDRMTREEFTAAFAAWFTAWTGPKSPQLTQPILQRSFESLFSRSVFQADQLYVKRGAGAIVEDSETRGGRGGRGRGGEGGGFNVGPSLELPGGIRLGQGGGGRGGRGGGGNGGRTLVTYYEPLDPLGPVLDPENILFIKLLAAPSLRARYLSYVREIADHWLTWQRLGPLARTAQALVADDVKRETHSPTGYIRFVQELDQDTGTSTGHTRDSTVAPNLKAFIEERRAYLQSHTQPND